MYLHVAAGLLQAQARNEPRLGAVEELAYQLRRHAWEQASEARSIGKLEDPIRVTWFMPFLPS